MKQEEVFLLRRWREEADDAWRISLKDVKAGVTHFFHSDADLCRYLGLDTEALEIPDAPPYEDR